MRVQRRVDEEFAASVLVLIMICFSRQVNQEIHVYFNIDIGTFNLLIRYLSRG